MTSSGGGIIPNNTQPGQQNQTVGQQAPNSLNPMQGPHPGTMGMGPRQQINYPGNPGINSNVVQQNMQKTIIWQGTLEWEDRKTDMFNSKKYQVRGNMTGEPELKTEGWPQELVMTFVQKNLLATFGNPYFKNVSHVMFNPEPSPALEVLTNYLGRGMACCIYVNNVVNSEVKIIILLFSPDKKAYVGFIPTDQRSFVAKIKDLIQNQKNTGMTGPGGPGPSNRKQMTGGMQINQNVPQNIATMNAGTVGPRPTGNMLLPPNANPNMPQTRLPGVMSTQINTSQLLAGGQVSGPGSLINPNNQPTSQPLINNTQMRMTLQQQIQQQQLQQQQQQEMRNNPGQQLQQMQQQRPLGQVGLGQVTGPGQRMMQPNMPRHHLQQQVS